ncbi:Rne/Rng family ribonuclease [Leptolyngbya sp. 15MV]|nr:Rne/Rng family ribonuclease [Leptolyngbya sp. 15MV]
MSRSKSKSSGKSASSGQPSKSQMLISYIPGEECRVAVVENGLLEEFHAESARNMSRVGNIYVGTVTNVEPAIQAAFVDFGVEHHGFLHVTDVHPRYFPGEDEEDTTESIGRKTPRRERPPIQKCFKRGDQIEVQVLKEGVGTKGPTLTSYLSIPGRFLVMMPQMDKVGVSRKVEDEDQRREMREILDQLDLPEGFGFILRTAGLDRTKLELKRDLAYLQRLWKDMEARKKAGNKPRLLYSESDLLVRALRDMITADIDEVIIDNELALTRAARFLKIVAPRSKVKLLQHAAHTPLFHAFGIEQQIAQIHAREVPLPSGGRLVIDETEALVAIDVNSGKSRDSKDAETNAYHTNIEAVDAICRQLKLRDLGGIVINDLIDMRLASHRKDIEERFKERLKRDRAKTTVLKISEFGILEMTRQRMRGSHETVHFGECPVCHGRGVVQKPDSVAADALRNLAALLDQAKVQKVELVVSPRVASELLSGKRRLLNRLERATGKHVDVRVSETIPVDRVTFYAYDEQGADTSSSTPSGTRSSTTSSGAIRATPVPASWGWSTTVFLRTLSSTTSASIGPARAAACRTSRRRCRCSRTSAGSRWRCSAQRRPLRTSRASSTPTPPPTARPRASSRWTPSSSRPARS